VEEVMFAHQTCDVKTDLVAIYVNALPELLVTPLADVFDQMNVRLAHNVPNICLVLQIHLPEERSAKIRVILHSVLVRRHVRLSRINRFALVHHNIVEIQLILILAATRLNVNRTRNVLEFWRVT
jgi:hypothetical protein